MFNSFPIRPFLGSQKLLCIIPLDWIRHLRFFKSDSFTITLTLNFSLLILD